MESSHPEKQQPLHKPREYSLVTEILAQANITVNGDRACDIQINNPAFYSRVLQHTSLGLGESYMDGWWECNRLDQFFYYILRENLDERITHPFNTLLYMLITNIINLQSVKRAWIVGKHHYDLGNDLFCAMLDPHMQYSCGYWAKTDTLEQAQLAKLQLICDKLQLQPGMTLLDIGCGWGGLAAFAAHNYGASVTGITISAEQQRLAQERCHRLDVEILLQDYRQINRSFDRVVSVGMFEHVGPRNYHDYFSIIARNLKEDGLFLLHTIGSNTSKNKIEPWTNKYIFPNGCLPSIRQIAKASESRLVIEDLHNFGADYDKTLMAWYANFKDAWPQLSQHYSERFYRMFSYYLNSCAGAFRARSIQLWQILFSREGIVNGLRVPR